MLTLLKEQSRPCARSSVSHAQCTPLSLARGRLAGGGHLVELEWTRGPGGPRPEGKHSHSEWSPPCPVESPLPAASVHPSLTPAFPSWNGTGRRVRISEAVREGRLCQGAGTVFPAFQNLPSSTSCQPFVLGAENAQRGHPRRLLSVEGVQAERSPSARRRWFISRVILEGHVQRL